MFVFCQQNQLKISTIISSVHNLYLISTLIFIFWIQHQPFALTDHREPTTFQDLETPKRYIFTSKAAGGAEDQMHKKQYVTATKGLWPGMAHQQQIPLPTITRMDWISFIRTITSTIGKKSFSDTVMELDTRVIERNQSNIRIILFILEAITSRPKHLKSLKQNLVFFLKLSKWSWEEVLPGELQPSNGETTLPIEWKTVKSKSCPTQEYFWMQST